MSEPRKLVLHASSDEVKMHGTGRARGGRRSSIQMRQANSGLDRMLRNRPTRHRVMAMNIIKEDGADLDEKKAKTSELMTKHLSNRPERKTLMKQNILSDQDATNHRGRLLLERSQKQDRLTTLLSRRSSLSELKQRGIHKMIEEDSKFSSARSLLGRRLGKRSSIIDLQRKGILVQQNAPVVEMSARKANLGNLLARRAGTAELERRNIIRAIDESKDISQESKAMLASYLLNRPTPTDMINQSFLTDVGFVSESVDEGSSLDFKKVVGLTVPITEVALGHGHSAVLARSGVIWTMGSGGDGGGTSPLGPMPLPGSSPVTHIACGIDHSVVISGGSAYSWGAGNWGRLGLGHQLSVDTPQKIDLGEEIVTQAECGAYHTLMLTASNKVFAFGWNKNGRVGTGEQTTIITSPQEIKVPTEGKVVRIGTGINSSFALDDTGKLFTWGAGSSGVLGHNDKESRSAPTLVAALEDEAVTLVAIGDSHAIVATASGRVLSWGRNSSGQLGREATDDNALSPVALGLDGKGVTGLSCGRNHSAVIKDGQLFTFGQGTHGMLGLGSEQDQVTPAQVQLADGVTVASVSLGWNHSAFVAGDGSVYTCGSRQHHQLGY